MGKLSRSKGHAWEREVATLMSQSTGRRIKRVLDETREGNARGDLDCADLPLTVQCKVGQRPNIANAVREAETATPKGYFSVAIVRRNGKNQHERNEDTATLPLEDFLELLQILTETGAW